MKKYLLVAFSFMLLLSACQKPSSTEKIPVANQAQQKQEILNLEPEILSNSTPEKEKNIEPESKKEMVSPQQEKNNEKDILGWIEGSVSYPSESLPEDLEVCAGQVEGDNQMYCTSQWIQDDKYTHGFGYKLALPEGIYQVMAEPSSGGLIGWYSAFVTCGETQNCTAHTPLNVEVKAGEGVEGIDPVDWHN